MIVVHCRIKPGGALNVLEALILKKIRSGQSVDVIFTLYSDRDFLTIRNDELCISNDMVGTTSEHKESVIRNSVGNNLIEIPIITALPRRLNTLFRRADDTKPKYISSIIDYRNLMPFFPILMKVLSRKLKQYINNFVIPTEVEGSFIDIESKGFLDSTSFHSKGQNTQKIIISSYAVAKNIDLPPNTHTEIYFHQPMHYVWTLYDEYVDAMHGRKKRLYIRVTPYLRRRDSKPRHYDIMYANSESTKAQISKIYGLGEDVGNGLIQVIHPPIDQAFFQQSVVTEPDNYFFYINRLTKMFKHLDKIIVMCNHYKIPLLIAGDGPDKEYLMSIAGPTITFLGRISNRHDKIQLIKRSKGVINIAHESFGIVTAEALLLGVPVFGYRGGATPELVNANNGVLTASVDAKDMYPAFETFVEQSFDRQAIQDEAKALLLPKQQFWQA